MSNTLLWVVQGLVALVLALTGTMKLAVPKERLAVRMHWAATWPRERIKLLGLAEVAGALGLVLPVATGIAPFLTPIAAVCSGILMMGAIRTHRQYKEGFGGAAVVGALCIAIAIGRGVALVH